MTSEFFCSMTAARSAPSLEEIRREIDSIDEELLELVVRRFEATSRVRASKEIDGSLAASPLRPAREAIVFRRLASQAKGRVSTDFLVRLWRVILSASTQSQAPVVLHVDNAIGNIVELRLQIAEHFCGMAVKAHDQLVDAFAALADRKGDLSIAATGSAWANDFQVIARHGVQLIGALPVISDGAAPRLLVFGHAEPQPSGNDETVVLSRTVIADANLPLRWKMQSGSFTVAGLPGFLSDMEATVFIPGCIIAGRYPCPIEVLP